MSPKTCNCPPHTFPSPPQKNSLDLDMHESILLHLFNWACSIHSRCTAATYTPDAPQQHTPQQHTLQTHRSSITPDAPQQHTLQMHRSSIHSRCTAASYTPDAPQQHTIQTHRSSIYPRRTAARKLIVLPFFRCSHFRHQSVLLVLATRETPSSERWNCVGKNHGR